MALESIMDESILSVIMDTDGISLQRVSDDMDAFWALLVGKDATVTVRARYAGYNNVFGVIPGIDGDPEEGFQGLVSSLSRNGTDIGTAFVPLPKDLVGDFRLAIRTPQGQIWSSLAADNKIDGMDHMVTWVDVKDPYHYFVAFEDLSFPGSDGDFNDVVLELHNVVDGPALPEPATLALTAIGLAGIGASRRRKERPAQ